MFKFFQFLWEHRQNILFLLLVLLSLSALSMSSRQRFQIARSINRSVLTPLQIVSARVDYYVHLKQENESLRKSSFLLALEVYRLEEVKRQNERLESLLGFVQRAPVEFVACRVVSGGLGESANIFVIDKGSNHGLTVNLPVLVPEGLVGKTIEVDSRSTVVQLYTHPDFRISVKPSGKEERMIAGAGPGGQLSLYNVPIRSNLENGDLIVSSGMGGIFPKGIPVGRVVDLKREEERGIQMRAELDPVVVLDRVSEVIVLIDRDFVSPEGDLMFEAADSLTNLWNGQ
jgi:rod shape-determining protein MreC